MTGFEEFMSFLTGMLVVAVVVLGVHDTQNIRTIKSLHRRVKQLESVAK